MQDPRTLVPREDGSDAMFARVVRQAAEAGTPFEGLLSRSPRLERRLIELTLARLNAARVPPGYGIRAGRGARDGGGPGGAAHPPQD